MRIRQAIGILKAKEAGADFRQHDLEKALGLLSKKPEVVERIACKPHWCRFWGSRYFVEPALVYERFGDGRCWGTLSPTNTRPNHYLIMGDSSWSDCRGSTSAAFYTALDQLILPAIEEQYGSDTFWCEECGNEWWEEENTCCSRERCWPALDSEGCGWCFPCYRNYYVSKSQKRRWAAKKAERKGARP